MMSFNEMQVKAWAQKANRICIIKILFDFHA